MSIEITNGVVSLESLLSHDRTGNLVEILQNDNNQLIHTVLRADTTGTIECVLLCKSGIGGNTRIAIQNDTSGAVVAAFIKDPTCSDINNWNALLGMWSLDPSVDFPNITEMEKFAYLTGWKEWPDNYEIRGMNNAYIAIFDKNTSEQVY